MSTTIHTSIHLRDAEPVRGEAIRVDGSDYDLGHYTIVKLHLGSHTLMIFPGDSAAALADVLTGLGASLAAHVEALVEALEKAPE